LEVEDGWVTLTGEVDWAHQAASVEQCLLVGVKGVTNKIRLQQRTTPVELKQDIAAAFARHAQREANHIAIRRAGR